MDEEHLQNLEKVCNRLDECGLRLSKGKCNSMKKQFKVWGFIIDKSGLQIAESKIRAIWLTRFIERIKSNWNLLRSINFYMRFLENITETLKPLHDLQTQKKFKRNGNSKAIKWVKNELISPKISVNFDSNEEIVQAYDASDYAV